MEIRRCDCACNLLLNDESHSRPPPHADRPLLSLRPIYALQAAPLLPLVAAKLRRTPAARLASVCRWVAPQGVAPCPARGWLPPVGPLKAAVIALERADVRAVWLRPLGKGLLVDRIVCGVAAGTTVALSPTGICDENSIDVVV